MLINTFIKYPYTADFWDYRIDSQDGFGNERVYFFSRTIKVMVYIERGALSILHPEVLPLGTQLRNIKDRQGKLISGSLTYSGGRTYELQSVEPVLNGYGYADTLRYVATVA